MNSELSRKARILIADDMATNRAVIRQLFKQTEYEIFEAEDGIQAMELLERQAVDVILLDVMMPRMDGLEVCRQLRKHPDLSLLPIILLTTLEQPEDIAYGMEAGATEYVTKPFNFVELHARVKAAVEQKRLTDRLDDTESVLFSLARMVEARDACTGNHCDRLAHIGVVFGERLSLPYEQLEALRRGGVLHDIGKLGIPDTILLKRGKLSSSEWETMKQHTVIGAALCAPLRTMRRTIDIIHSHHDRWDGSGYPQGLAGEQIPLLARVFQIVDIFDALSSKRPYKPALPQEQAIAIMEEETDKGYWDPSLMREFLDMVEEDAQALLPPSAEANKDRSAHILDDILATGVKDWYQTN